MTDNDVEPLARRFPADFRWGFATSAYQIEGAAREDGRGASIWDTFSHTPGRVANGDNGDVACDHYHRYAEDVRLMADLGATGYRFSVSWPRIFPTGRGRPNGRGIDFYRRLLDELRGVGIEPLVTLFHWDLPQALQDLGGFANPDVVGWFGDYAELMAARLGDLVSDWVTLNEPAVFAFEGHADGAHAPGIRHWPTAMRVAHNQLVAHARATDAIRATSPDARVGIALDLTHVVPATDSDRDVNAAVQHKAARDRWFLDPLFGRGYPEAGLSAHRSARHLDGVDLEVPPVRSLDFLGVNYYRRLTVSAGTGRPFGWRIETSPGTELTSMGWEVVPEGLSEVLISLRQDYAPAELLVTENGAAYPDPVSEDGMIHDADRVSYLERHVAAAADAVAAGVPLRGYYIWSLLDNFEWAHGYRMRFGVVHLDRATQQRTPKDSALWFRRLARG